MPSLQEWVLEHQHLITSSAYIQRLFSPEYSDFRDLARINAVTGQLLAIRVSAGAPSDFGYTLHLPWSRWNNAPSFLPVRDPYMFPIWVDKETEIIVRAMYNPSYSPLRMFSGIRFLPDDKIQLKIRIRFRDGMQLCCVPLSEDGWCEKALCAVTHSYFLEKYRFALLLQGHNDEADELLRHIDQIEALYSTDENTFLDSMSEIES